MKRNLSILIGTFFVITSSFAQSQIPTYEATDNAGLNKRERIDSVEKYVIDLSSSLRSMESKLDENAKKIKALDDTVKGIKEELTKKEAAKLGEQKAPQKESKEVKEIYQELDKLKSDILSMKNQDIEKLKINFEELSETVRMLQATSRK